MAYYQVLERPAGTLGYKPDPNADWLGVFKGGAEELGKGVKRGMVGEMYRSAAAKEGLKRKIKIDAEGNPTIEYEQPTEKEKSFDPSKFGKSLQLFTAGLLPEEVEKEMFGDMTDDQKAAIQSKLAEEAEQNEGLRTVLGYPKKEKPAKLTYNDVIKQAISGEKDWSDVETEFPTQTTKTKELKKGYTPAETNVDFKEAKGFFGKVKSAFSGNLAPLSSKDKKLIGNIKTQADLEEFLENEEDYGKAGINVKAIKEYFGK